MLQRDIRKVTRTPTWHSCPRQPQDTEAQGTTEATAAQSPALFPGGLGAQARGDALARPSPPRSPPGEQIPSSQREGRGSAGLRGPEPSLVSQAICRGLDPLQRRPEPAQSPRGQQRVLLWVPFLGPATRPLTHTEHLILSQNSHPDSHVAREGPHVARRRESHSTPERQGPNRP